MKEISRRIMKSAEDGVACGPVSVYAIDAEIVVEDEGKEVFLHTQWVAEVDDMMLFEATTKSMYELYDEMNRALDTDDMDTFNQLIEERDRRGTEDNISRVFGNIDISERYAEQYQQLIQMMQEVVNEDGLGCDLTEIEL